MTGLAGFELKRVMRTGTVASVDNRNWEIGDPAIIRRLSQSRAIALDMEFGSNRRQRLSLPRAIRHPTLRLG